MGTFSDIATGITAYNTFRTNQAMEQVQQSLAHLQMAQMNAAISANQLES